MQFLDSLIARREPNGAAGPIHPRILERLEQTLRDRLAQYREGWQQTHAHLSDVFARLTHLQQVLGDDPRTPLLTILRLDCCDLLRRVAEFSVAVPSEAEIAEVATRAQRLGHAVAKLLPADGCAAGASELR